uniref:Uncharacterized protein n=1 Tax=Arundo donax TaxID=35708 RepID=A0A0A9EZ89_ARUDO
MLDPPRGRREEDEGGAGEMVEELGWDRGCSPHHPPVKKNSKATTPPRHIEATTDPPSGSPTDQAPRSQIEVAARPLMARIDFVCDWI